MADHDWWQTSARNGVRENGVLVEGSVMEFECRLCKVASRAESEEGDAGTTWWRRVKRVMVPTSASSLKEIGPVCPETCEETAFLLAAHAVHSA